QIMSEAFDDAHRAANGSDIIEAEIKRLAALSAVAYEQERKNAAERLGLRASILDKLVQAQRPDDDDANKAAQFHFPNPSRGPNLLMAQNCLTASPTRSAVTSSCPTPRATPRRCGSSMFFCLIAFR